MQEGVNQCGVSFFLFRYLQVLADDGVRATAATSDGYGAFAKSYMW